MDASMEVHDVVDVLVVGGGLAGCWAAIAARDLGADVTVVDKGFVGKTSMSKFAAGDIKCFMPGDDLDAWMKEMVDAGEHLNDEEWIRIIFNETYPRVLDMERWGVRFEKRDGEFVRKSGRTLVTKQVVFNAAQMMDRMRRALEERGVRVFDKVFVFSLLKDDGRVVGALGFHRWTGQVHVFPAKAVVLASGGCGFRSIYYGQQFATGDGLAMAFEGGAEVMNMEFVHWNTCSRHYDVFGMSRFVAFGGRFLNARGEAFMSNYDPVWRDRAPTPKLVLAMAFEVRRGNGPIFFDLTSISDDDYQLSRKLIPSFFKVVDRAGIDIRKDRLEWVPALRGASASPAGLKIDYSCATSVPGLYAAGDVAAKTAYGASSGYGGINLAWCCVSGYRAGRGAALASRDVAHVRLPSKEAISQEASRVFEPLRREDGISADEVTLSLQKAIIPYDVLIIRHGERLGRALEEVMRIKLNMVPRLYASDIHELVKCVEARNMVSVAELILRSSIARTESRGGFYREDYPRRDDERWLKYITLRKVNGEVELSVVPIHGY
jgi:succinate dehydrogenase/fumarate reductase flavoprotein subunit